MEYSGVSLTATIINFPTPRSNDLLRRVDALNRDCFHLYEATLVLLLAAIELHLAILGMKDRG